MTPEELNTLLDDRDLYGTLDVKTLVVDLVRKMNQAEIEEIFWQHLPKLKHDAIKGYFYMSRG